MMTMNIRMDQLGGAPISVQTPTHLHLPQEEITTIFVVGFPEDIHEREFQNMFTFAAGFEAATLKFPANFDADDGVPQYKKQIIGFAKFRTRLEALQARDHLSGRRVDAERGCILKAEIAKKNLHTKRGISVEYSSMIGSSQHFTAMSGAAPMSPMTLNSGLLSNNIISPNPNLSMNSSAVASSMMAPHNVLTRRQMSLSDFQNQPANKQSTLQYPQILSREILNGSQLAGRQSGLQGLDFLALDAESDLATPTLLRSAFSPATADSGPADSASSRQPSELEFRPPPSVISARSILDSPRFDRPYPDINESASPFSSALFPQRSRSSSLVNTELRGFNSALFSSESLLSSHHHRFPTLSINTKLASLAATREGSQPSASGTVPVTLGPSNAGTANFQTSSLAGSDNGASSPLLAEASPSTAFGPGYRSLADQNPPCNTLYVGNLPPNASETELRDLFTRCIGYKRLSFRVRPNGPMCFVEFDDVQYAQTALNELHGYPLSNSMKGGIRLSFSKNPLGVRQMSLTPVPQTSSPGTQVVQPSTQQVAAFQTNSDDSGRLVFSF